MTSFKTYNKVIFGRKGAEFEGVDQGYDPHSEPMGRVQYAMDIDFSNQTLKKRLGFDIIKRYDFASVIGVADIKFPEVGQSIAVATGAGDIFIIRDLLG